MAPKCFGSLSILALAGTALSRAFVPEPTVTDPAVMRDGVSPVPTNGPKHELVKRDSALWDTCGWISSSTSIRGRDRPLTSGSTHHELWVIEYVRICIGSTL